MRCHLIVIPLVVALTASACSSRAELQRSVDSLTAGKDSASTLAYRASDTPAAKIASAMSAAPRSIAEHATIMDWPAKEGEKAVELRAGTNGWVCFPNSPENTGAAGDDPMCLDKQFASWGEAWMSHRTPQISGVAIAYMLRGDRGASNTDPYATAETPDNQWVRAGPHIMVATSDTKLLDSLPTDPKTGGPWVMWKGTPYAHIMVPVR